MLFCELIASKPWSTLQLSVRRNKPLSRVCYPMSFQERRNPPLKFYLYVFVLFYLYVCVFYFICIICV